MLPLTENGITKLWPLGFTFGGISFVKQASGRLMPKENPELFAFDLIRP